MNIEQELKDLEKHLSKDKSDLDKAEGSIETLMKRLKEEEEINTLPEADTIIQELEGQITFLNKDISDKITSVKEIYLDRN